MGFNVEMVASGFEQPRVIRTAPNGDLFVADSEANEIHVLRMNGGSATPAENSVFASGLNQPYGIAFYPLGPNPEWVYVANTDSVVRYPYKDGDLAASGKAETVVDGLPTGYHWTRDIAFASDGSRMFVSVGSGSNIGEDVTGEPDGGIPQFAADNALGAMWGEEFGRANVLSFKPDGSDKQVFATGLRNCSGLTVQPQTSALWCVVNERDELGDNLPPDYATVVKQGEFFGWPWFYIGDHEDPRAPLKGQRPDLAGKVSVPDVLFQAHSAPLGVTFYDGNMFPAEYKGDAFVTFHGSWNRGNRTGYKVVRMLVDDEGKPTGEYQDFMTGFVQSADKVWGRPVGVTAAKDGSLIVTEDGVRHDLARQPRGVPRLLTPCATRTKTRRWQSPGLFVVVLERPEGGSGGDGRRRYAALLITETARLVSLLLAAFSSSRMLESSSCASSWPSTLAHSRSEP